MSTLMHRCAFTGCIFALFLASQAALAQTTAFTYQGKLTDNGNPATGNYDFQFKLFDTQTVGTGTQQGGLVTVANVTVTAGIFTVELDFGACASCFNGAARFLEIAVKQTSGSTFTTLSPRQPVASTPYAIKSQNATLADGFSVACVNCVTSGQIQSIQGSQVTGNISGSQISGAIPVASVPAGSANYIQNTVSQQVSSNFNISGNGTAGGNLSASIVNATTQYNFGGSRVLSVSGVGSFVNSNTFAGIGAGASTTPDASGNGSLNSFFGQNAGQNNTTGQGNSFYGMQAGQFSTGSFNSFFGTSAGANTSISGANAFFGYQAGLANINGGANAFFGYQAGKANTSGGNNEFFGFQAGGGNTSGGGNAFFGQAAGANNGTGTRNTMIGNQADVGANNLNNATAVGSQALVSQSNSLVLGAINGTNGATADTSVGIGTTAPTFKLQVIDPSNTGLRVQTNTAAGTVASFGGKGDFQIDTPGTTGGRFIVKESGNVGIGTNNPQSKLHVQGEARVTGGNLFIAQPNSLVITSPNGSCWQIRVSDAGVLTAASVTCP